MAFLLKSNLLFDSPSYICFMTLNLFVAQKLEKHIAFPTFLMAELIILSYNIEQFCYSEANLCCNFISNLLLELPKHGAKTALRLLKSYMLLFIVAIYCVYMLSRDLFSVYQQVNSFVLIFYCFLFYVMDFFIILLNSTSVFWNRQLSFSS